VNGTDTKKTQSSATLSVKADPSTPPITLEEAERRHILTVVEHAKGVIDGPNGAARILDMHPNTLRSRMKKLGIQRRSHEMP